MIPLSVPNEVSQQSLIGIIADVIRRAIDGTIVPLVVDYTNQRLLIGTSAAQTVGPNGKIEITGGDVRVVDSGKGMICTTPDGTKQYRITVDNSGRVECSQV